MLLGLDSQQPITNDRWINVTQKGSSCRFAGWAFFAGCWQLARVGLSNISFIRLRGSILRRWRGPSPRAYGLGLSHIGFYTARGIHPAPMARSFSKGLRFWGVFHIGFQDATRIHPAPMARPLSRGLRDWGCRTLDFIRLGGSILRRRRSPSLGAYGIGVVAHWILYG